MISGQQQLSRPFSFVRKLVFGILAVTDREELRLWRSWVHLPLRFRLLPCRSAFALRSKSVVFVVCWIR